MDNERTSSAARMPEPPRLALRPAEAADDALAAENVAGRRDDHPGPEPAARDAAADWLRELLRPGPRLARDLRSEATAAGYAWRTVQRAADHIGAIRRKCNFAHGWTWELPPEDANRTCQDTQETDNLASWHLRENGPENAVSACQDAEDAKFADPGIFDTKEGRGDAEWGEI